MNAAAPKPIRRHTEMTRPRPSRERAMDELIGAARAAGYGDAALFALRLGLEEAISNAFNHGHANLPDDAPVSMAWTITPRRIEVEIEDQGPGFDPSDVPDPTLEQNLESESGRGLTLMRAYMESLEYNEKGNRIRMVYRNPAAGE